MAWIDLTLLFARRPLGVEEHCYELLHSNKTEINISLIIIIIHLTTKIIIQIFFLLFIYLLKLEIQTALLGVAFVLSRHDTLQY